MKTTIKLLGLVVILCSNTLSAGNEDGEWGKHMSQIWKGDLAFRFTEAEVLAARGRPIKIHRMELWGSYFHKGQPVDIWEYPDGCLVILEGGRVINWSKP